MKTSELRALSGGDLQVKLRELAQELDTLRLKSRTSGIEKPHIVRQLRRDIARVQTILQELARGHIRTNPSA